MPISIEVKQPNLVVAVYTGEVTDADFQQMNASFDNLSSASQDSTASKFYLIHDVRAIETMDFSTLLRQMTGAPQEIGDMEFVMAFVGDAPLAKLAVQLAKRKDFFGGLDVPMFRTMEDALAFIDVDQGQEQSEGAA